MATTSHTRIHTHTRAEVTTGPPGDRPGTDRGLVRWGGLAGVGGALALLASFIVVSALGLPDASDVETLTDFADIENGRIAEHFLYLGSVVLFALSSAVLQRRLRPHHEPAALFGGVLTHFGLVIMAASSVLHLSTSPLADLYTAADATADDQRAVEFAWHGAQSVFDTMLATGALLVPIGMMLFGLAMRAAPGFGSRFALGTVVLGAVGTVGAVIGVVDPGSLFLALPVLAIAVFHLALGVHALRSGRGTVS